MLNKSVCKKCFDRQLNDIWLESVEEDQWRSGYIICPEEIGLRERAKIKSAPPKWCPYSLEHAVAETIHA